MNTNKSAKSLELLESISKKKLTIGNFLYAIREGEELTQTAFAKQLKISRQYLCDIENGRRGVSPQMAFSFARRLGYSEKQFIRLALQDELDRQHLHFEVELKETA
jgi:transcriptional regulator with XRE-family HTH domain